MKIHWLAWNKLCKPKVEGGLGIRDIENFNLALLGKQVWRLIHNTDSLLYKVFKARYFPRCTIMDVEVSLNGSYAWQSILKARHVISMGATWRIGNGESVFIRGDRWLPDPHSNKVISPQKNFPGNTRVCALLEEDGSRWLTERVTEEFLPHEAQIILSIPLSSRRIKDTLIWLGTKNGVYSTKSAYLMLQRLERIEKPGPSHLSGQDVIWKHIWELTVPSKVKHFLWRACNESLPTKKNLFRRQVIRTATCDGCREETEDSVHALWGCQVVKETWWEAIQDRNQLWERFQSFRDLLIRIFNIGAPFLAERFAYVAWSLWNKRNAIRTQSHYLPYSMIYSDAVDRLNEYHSCLDHHANEVPHPPLVKWQAPTKDLYKANFDGALFHDIHSAGIGVVIKDHLG